MNETIDCTNCCIADFKHSLCDCNGDFCTKYKSIGDENDFMQAVLMDRPSGEWIDDIEAESNGYYWANCSQCGLQIDVHENRGYYNYCPHCGARMKDVTEGLESRTDLIWYGDKTDLIGDETGRHTGWFGKGADDDM